MQNYLKDLQTVAQYDNSDFTKKTQTEKLKKTCRTEKLLLEAMDKKKLNVENKCIRINKKVISLKTEAALHRCS